MVLVMLPLWITSFPVVRKKMHAKAWKRLQRWAYLFYALLCLHILLLTIPNALRGRPGYGLTVFVYTAIFVAYALCRVLKALARRRRSEHGLARRQLAAIGFALLAAGALTLAISWTREGGTAGETPAIAAPSDALSASAVPVNTDSPATAPPTPASANEASSPNPEKTPEPTQTMAEPSSAPSVPPTEQAQEELPTPQQPTPEPTSQPMSEPTPQLTPQPTPQPTPEAFLNLIYQDGTYSGSGVGNLGTSGDITVSVMIRDDIIVDIRITAFKDDSDYFDPATDGARMIAAMLSAQSPNVDGVSGATYSSDGLRAAVRAALNQARR